MKKKNIHYKQSKSQLCFIVLSLLLILLSVIFIYMRWDDMPEQLPSHFGLWGEPDAWGNKDSIWDIQLFGILMFLFMWAMKYTPNLWHISLHITNENRKDIYMIAYDMFAQLQLIFSLFVLITTYSIVEDQRIYDWAIIGILLISLIIIIIHLIRLRKYKKRRTRHG